MLSKRVIACLDVRDGKLAKSVKFVDTKDIGDPVEQARMYYEQGLDELVFFDITASAHGRTTMVDVIQRAADQCFMPLTVGGGLRSVADMHTMLKAGADKISINRDTFVEHLLADGTGFKRRPDPAAKVSNKGELRLVLGVTLDGRLRPFGVWAQENWEQIAAEFRRRTDDAQITEFLHVDGEEAISEAVSRSPTASRPS
jgi:phosphoribosylformimino-5-aminoimidazole carboxamide ribonucleotide (ProFAR) isomerase